MMIMMMTTTLINVRSKAGGKANLVHRTILPQNKKKQNKKKTKKERNKKN